MWLKKVDSAYFLYSEILSCPNTKTTICLIWSFKYFIELWEIFWSPQRTLEAIHIEALPTAVVNVRHFSLLVNSLWWCIWDKQAGNTHRKTECACVHCFVVDVIIVNSWKLLTRPQSSLIICNICGIDFCSLPLKSHQNVILSPVKIDFCFVILN